MHVLDRKLVRDLWRLRGQVLAIAMVIASGVGILIMALSTSEALDETARAYYERYRFADVFAGAKRVPDGIADRIARIPGVQTLQTRVSHMATLDMPGFIEPVIGQLVSIPERAEPVLNRLVMRSGRSVRAGYPDEVILSEPFAEAHALVPGDRFKAIMNGNKRTLTVVGIALSPEFIYAIGPGALMPDKKRFGIFWMGRKALAAAYDLDGAFNDVSVSLRRGTNPREVILQLDRILDRFGGTGAYERKDQISNWFLMNEIEQQKTMATILPTIFLAVAAFLANMVMGRLIATERSEIGLMKAFGYGNMAVGWHYIKMVMVIAGLGILLGWALGAWLGRFNTETYGTLYRFPFLLYRPSPSAFLLSGFVSLTAALLGTLGAVRLAARLPPAEAIRPPAPPLYARNGLATGWLGRFLDQSTRIILRQIARWPKRSALTISGIAMTLGVLILTLQWLDAIDHMITTYFFDAQRQTMTVGLVEAESRRSLHEFDRMPAVLSVEPARLVSAQFQVGRKRHRGSVEGVRPDARLQVIYDVGGRTIRVPPRGLVLSETLARKLNVREGGIVTVKILEGRRVVRDVPVVGLFKTYIGTPAYMHLNALNRLLREPTSVRHVHLLVDDAKKDKLFQHLKELPSISAITLRRAAVDTFNETMAQTLMIFVSFFIGFACTLAVGIVYNSPRISLSERGRELATLRVLGFSHGEVTYILLGEVMLLVLVGLPTGCVAGYILAGFMISAFDTELFRVPFAIAASTYGLSILIALGATAGSMALVRRHVYRLDLIAVLKTRE